MMRAILIAAGFLAAGGTLADDFDCAPKERFNNYTAESDDIRLNNFELLDKASKKNPIAAIGVQYAVTNRRAFPLRMSADFIFKYSNGEVGAAMSALPTFGIIGANLSATATGYTLVDPGFMLKVKSICVRIMITPEM